MSAGTRDIAAIWAEYAAGVTYDALPGDVRKVIRWLVLDTLATTLAANTLGVGVPQLLHWARGAGGAREATLLGFGDRLPATTAAMVNGGMAHALNFDDTTAVGSGHLGPVTFPSAFAAAELKGGATGKELMTAIAAGAELMSRIGVAITRPPQPYTEAKPQPTQMPGFFAAAVSAGRMLEFDAPRMHSAIGLAYMQASGGRQPVLDGRPAKAIYTAFSNQGGMQAALLTRLGLLGDCDAFEGKAGFFPTYHANVYDRPALVDDLGSTFYLTNVGFKPWPTTGVAHVFIAAAAELHAALDPADVVRVRIAGEPHLASFCEPSQLRRNPQAPVEAEDSVLFATAKALVRGGVTLADLQPTTEGLFESHAVRIANLIEWEVDESLGKSGVVEVTLASGEVRSKRVDLAPGHRDNPLTDDQRRAKFYACAQHAGTRLDDAALREVVDMAGRLDDVTDVRDFARLLTGAPAR